MLRRFGSPGIVRVSAAAPAPSVAARLNAVRHARKRRPVASDFTAAEAGDRAAGTEDAGFASEGLPLASRVAAGGSIAATADATTMPASSPQTAEETGDDSAAIDWSEYGFRSGPQFTPDVSGLRGPGMMAAPATTSLDRIRAELKAMREETARREAEAANARFLAAQQRSLASEQERGGVPAAPSAEAAGAAAAAAASDVPAWERATAEERRRRYKPQDAYLRGADVRERVRERQARLVERVCQQADEVLRLKNSADTRRYARLALPQVFAPPTEVVAATAERLLASYEARLSETLRELELPEGLATADLLAATTGADTTSPPALAPLYGSSPAVPGDEPPEGDGAALRELAELAWLAVLDEAPDADLRLLQESGVVDADLVEAVLAGAGDGGGASSAALLESRLRAICEAAPLAAVTREIADTTLGGLGGGVAAHTLDLVPVLAKVHAGQYEEISREELQALEAYEEAAVLRLATRAQPAQRETATARGGGRNDGASAAEAPASRAATGEALLVSPALLDEALLPTNSFLHAVATRAGADGEDDTGVALRESLAALERIKRHSLLDPDFHLALRAAHEAEEIAVQPHVRGERHSRAVPSPASGSALHGLFDGDTGDRSPEEEWEEEGEGEAEHGRGDPGAPAAAGKQKRHLSKRERRMRAVAALRGPAARPTHAADVPFFFNSPTSVVPPRGRFSLPDPAPTAEEKALRRGARRRRFRATQAPYSQ